MFPFILRDYESEELDLENAASFRDLRKPIAVQDKSRERKYMDNYEVGNFLENVCENYHLIHISESEACVCVCVFVSVPVCANSS